MITAVFIVYNATRLFSTVRHDVVSSSRRNYEIVQITRLDRSSGKTKI